MNDTQETKSQEQFPIENYRSTILILFKHTINGRPVMQSVRGNSGVADSIMKGGRHTLIHEDGHEIVFNGNDVLWAECFTAEENRQRAIQAAKAGEEKKAADIQAFVQSARKAERDEILKIVGDAIKTGRMGFVRKSAFEALMK